MSFYLNVKDIRLRTKRAIAPRREVMNTTANNLWLFRVGLMYYSFVEAGELIRILAIVESIDLIRLVIVAISGFIVITV